MNRRPFTDLVNLMTRLRSPGGCPWDREQTLQTLKPFIIEEAYEVVDAIDQGEVIALVEELGDLMLQVVFAAEIGREQGQFDVENAVAAVHDKLVRRHPHVFGDVKADSAEAVLTNWERLKNEERKDDARGILSGVPLSLPALLKASRLTEKAARIGFDWRRTDEVFDKVDEEMRELREAAGSGDTAAVEEELGDLLFTIANVARKLKVNPEEALQAANRKFTRRFESMESSLRERDASFEGMTLEEMDELWNAAKRRGL
jgi:tetrapyrrole methylase family protein / MazG family protein